MNDFLKKWKNDKKYRAKIKLIAYFIFISFISIYAISLNNSIYNSTHSEVSETPEEKTDDIIKLKDTYEYKITIDIDDKTYEYSGTQNETERTINKTIDNKTTKYIYKDNTYYLEDQTTNYMVTTKDEVYDIINYNYINIDTINEYLKKAEKNNNQYIVYIKDIVLGNNSENYFIIDINKNKIFIDYTALMREFNTNIQKYKVSIEINE